MEAIYFQNFGMVSKNISVRIAITTSALTIVKERHILTA